MALIGFVFQNDSQVYPAIGYMFLSSGNQLLMERIRWWELFLWMEAFLMIIKSLSFSDGSEGSLASSSLFEEEVMLNLGQERIRVLKDLTNHSIPLSSSSLSFSISFVSGKLFCRKNIQNKHEDACFAGRERRVETLFRIVSSFQDCSPLFSLDFMKTKWTSLSRQQSNRQTSIVRFRQGIFSFHFIHSKYM